MTNVFMRLDRLSIPVSRWQPVVPHFTQPPLTCDKLYGEHTKPQVETIMHLQM